MGIGGVVDFVAIDFETANEERGSACEIGLVRFTGGQVVDRFQSLIYQDYFNPFNVSLHGISEKQVAKAPSFDDVWAEAKMFIDDSPLLAHNAGFDIGVLFHSLELDDIGGNYTYFCSLVLSRRLLDISYFGLPGVTEHLGIEYPMNHRAEGDAEAAGKVAVALMAKKSVDSLHELAELVRVRPGVLNSDGYSGSRYMGEPGGTGLSMAEKKRILDAVPASERYEDPDFAGKRIVFTGALLGMKRDDAELAVMKAGGIPSTSVSKKTNMLVFGYQDPNVLRGKALSGKRLAAEKLRHEGVKIEVVDELQFMQMLNTPQGYAT
jgi:DNA polymerase III epsilon subunit-like protein